MRRNFISISIFVLLVLSVAAEAATGGGFNLYRVWIGGKIEVETLSHMPADVVYPVRGGYLVTASPLIESRLQITPLRYEIIAADVDPGSLYRDIRRGTTEPLDFPVIFEDAGIRIYSIDTPIYGWDEYAGRLDHIRAGNLPVKYDEAGTKSFTISRSEELDSLINGISQDTLTYYVEHLQSFNSRLSGTDGNLESAYWIKSRLESFGYDSVAYDTGTWDGYGNIYLNRNVVAYKRGSVYPYHQIIIGAHRDAVPDSPGADDNGSGTSGVLEIARILSNYDSRMSLVFVLFDTEEVGLGGSKLYAYNAHSRGDHIELMVNLDMIGHYENENDIYVNHGFGVDSVYAQLWAHLADSLPGIGLNGYLDHYILSDESSFEEYGYTVLWLFEYIFSTVYHSAQDSAVYMNFDYMTRVVKTTLATIATVDQNFEPGYELYLTGPDYPEMLIPETETPIEITALEFGGASIVPGSVQLHYAIDGGDTTLLEMTFNGDGQFIGNLPALPCGHEVFYYISVEDDSLGVFNYPKSGSGVRAFVTGDMTYALDDDFESDLGWTVSGDATASSQWSRFDPAAGHGLWGSPPADFDGSLLCYMTGEGTGMDVDGGTTALISPVIDASAGDMLVQYARWYSNDYGVAPHTDVFNVLLSNNGGTSWVPVETVGPVEQASGDWYFREFWISDFLTPTASMRLRFDASDLGADSHIEAAVDAVKFIRLTEGPHITTEALPGWTAGVPYSQQLEAIVCSGEITWSDKYGSLDGTGLSLSNSGLLSGLPLGSGTVYFFARADGESGGSDEKAFSLRINPPLAVVTLSVPGGTIGQYLEYHLLSSGGTGTRVWTEPDNILQGTGLALSSGGLISGTPTTVGDFSFTARVTDAVGAVKERLFNFKVREPFICGDANSDGEVNVGDPLYIINYVFKGGPPPQTPDAADVNYDHAVNVADAVYLINYIFKGGSTPFCP